jgi:tetratricopeptide (TPR) repeat protein
MKITMVIVVGAVLLSASMTAWSKQMRGAAGEVQYSNEEYKLLDTFEAHRLSKADEVFAGGDHRRAYAEYDSFLLDFPRSRAVPYALLRKARSLHLQHKRFEAIKAYQEVLDYFPNAVNYAAPAKFHIGQCHWHNGDIDKALKAWAEMASDKEYNRHPLGATAFVQLADELVKQGRPDQAAQYYEQVALTFRTDNPDAAQYAIGRVIAHYTRTSPNEPKLRSFYQQARTFDGRPRAVDGDLSANREYWDRIREAVRRHGSFGPQETSARDRYYKYWAGVMDGKFSDWDDFQIDLAEFKLQFEGDVKKWVERLDRQFQQHQKPDDFDRVIRWIALFREHIDKVNDYYARINFDKMSNGQIVSLMRVAYDAVGNVQMGRSVFNRVRLAQMADNAKSDLAKYFWRKDAGIVRDIYAQFQDKDRGKFELLQFYASSKDYKNGLPLAEEVIKLPAYAKEALVIKADMLFGAREFEKAIAAYQQCDNPPSNLWQIAECYAQLKRWDQAVEQLREVENFFREHQAEAAYRIAQMYRRAGAQEQYVASLRAVLRKYPHSRQSSVSENELERLGIHRRGGGIDAE